MQRRFIASATASVATVALLLAARDAAAATLYWDANGTSSAWGIAANWSTDPEGTTDPTAPPGIDDLATFNTTPANTNPAVITLNGGQSALGLVFNTTSSTRATITAGTGGPHTLTIGTSGIRINTGALPGGLDIGSTTAAQAVLISLAGSQTWFNGNGSNVDAGRFVVHNAVSLGVSGAHTLTIGGTTGTSSVNVINGTISDGTAGGVLSLTMTPTGNANRWNLGGTNTYTGLTTVTLGALGLSNASALGSTSGATVVQNGGALFLRNANTTYAAEPITITGNGPVDSANGALRSLTGGTIWTGPITADATARVVRIGHDPTGRFTIAASSSINVLGTNSVQFSVNHASGEIVVDAPVTGSGGVSRGSNATGFATLTGTAKAYTGPTNVDAGSLVVNTTLSNTSALVVAASGILRGNDGVINASATATVNGTLAPGYVPVAAGPPATTPATPAVGTLSMGALTLGGTSTYLLNINTAAPASDLVNVAGNLTIAATNNAVLTITDLAASSTALPVGTAIEFIDYTGTWNGGLFRVLGNPIADEMDQFTVGENTYEIDYNGGDGSDVLLRVVPEPGTAGLALVGAALAGLRRRRRRA